MFNRLFGRKLDNNSEHSHSDFPLNECETPYTNHLGKIRLFICRDRADGRDLVFDSKSIERKHPPACISPPDGNVPSSSSNNNKKNNSNGNNNNNNNDSSNDNTVSGLQKQRPHATRPASASRASRQFPRPPQQSSTANVAGRRKDSTSAGDAYIKSPTEFDNVEFSKKLPVDFSLLTEMIFGNMPLQYKVSAVKIHTFKNPIQIMMSKTFFVIDKPRGNISMKEHRSFISLFDSEYPISQPIKIDEQGADDCSMASSWNSSCSRLSYSSLPLPRRSIGSCQSRSLASRYIRWLAGQKGQITSMEAKANVSASKPASVRIGLAIILPLVGCDDQPELASRRFHSMFFSYVPLVENIVNEMAFGLHGLTRPRHGICHYLKMEQELEMRLLSLFSSSRLASPAWLSLAKFDRVDAPKRLVLVRRIASTLAELAAVSDSSQQKFINSVITGVLMYHTNWIGTVTPSGCKTRRACLLKHDAEWVSGVNCKYPYAPQWTQLMELLGCVGRSRLNKQSRTVVVGKDKLLVMKIVFALSYFIRSSCIVSNKVAALTVPDELVSDMQELDNMQRTGNLESPEPLTTDTCMHDNACGLAGCLAVDNSTDQVPRFVKVNRDQTGGTEAFGRGQFGYFDWNQMSDVRSDELNVHQQNQTSADQVSVDSSTSEIPSIHEYHHPTTPLVWVPLLPLDVNVMRNQHEEEEEEEATGSIPICTRSVAGLSSSNSMSTGEARNSVPSSLSSRLTLFSTSGNNLKAVDECNEEAKRGEEWPNDDDFIDLGRSLFGGFSEKFVPDFVLHGCSDLTVASELQRHILPRQSRSVAAHRAFSVQQGVNPTTSALHRCCLDDSSSNNRDDRAAVNGRTGCPDEVRYASPSSVEIADVLGKHRRSQSRERPLSPLEFIKSCLKMNGSHVSAHTMTNNVTTNTCSGSSQSITLDHNPGPSLFRPTTVISDQSATMGLTESNFVVADLESLVVCAYSSHAAPNVELIRPSSMVSRMLQLIRNLSKPYIPSEFILLCVEDKLQEFYLQAKSMHELSVERDMNINDCLNLAGMDEADKPLIQAIDDVLLFDDEASQYLPY